MESTKPVSARLPIGEVDAIDGMAHHLGVDRTTLIRRALRHYAKEIRRQSEDRKPTIVDAAKMVVKRDKNSLVLDHPFAQRIMNDGIKVEDDNGHKVAEIRNLVQLLNFVETKVFRE